VDDNKKIVRNYSGNKVIFILVLSAALSITFGFSLNQQSKPTRQSALDAFSKGNFELAFKQFSELSASYPGDPLYKYYSGVTLVKLERDPVRATILLKEAQQGSGAIRTIPDDAAFYIGRALQLSGNFTEATGYYKQYTQQAGKKTAREASTPQLIQQCNEKKGAIVNSKTTDAEINKDSAISPLINEKAIPGGKRDIHKTDTIFSKEKIPPPEYEKLLNDALNYQFTADSLNELVAYYRKQIDSIPVPEKSALRVKISETGQLAFANQKLANDKLIDAEKFLRPTAGQNVSPEKEIKQDSIQEKSEMIPVVIHDNSGIKKDTLAGKKADVVSKDIMQMVDNHIFKDTVNQIVKKEMNVVAQQEPVEIFSIFEVVEKPVYATDETVPVNPEVQAGLIYRIQVAVFRNPVSPAYFKGITPVYGFKSPGSEVTNYYAGMFRKSSDASKSLIKVKSAGFKDAFVVPLFDKKIVSSERAGILEKEWGNKPLIIETGKIPDSPRDTIPPTLIFRVEVTKSPKPLTPIQLDNIRKLAGNRGLDVIKNESGQTIYLIGKFLTFESASEYADLLIRNGQKEAIVTAYLGRREIPVETAKQLFEKF
jgi:hypothetical protein